MSRAPGGWTRVDPARRRPRASCARACDRPHRPGLHRDRRRQIARATRLVAGIRRSSIAPFMLGRARRLLPHGWPDLLRQIVLFCGAYWLYRLVRGQVVRPGGRGVRQRARDRSRIERVAARCSSSRRCSSWAQAHGLRRRRRELDVPQLALRRHDVHAGLHLPVPQRALLLRAQHVHGRDGHRAGRLRALSRPRRRGCCRSRASPTRSRTSPASSRLGSRRRALQPVRRGAVDARRRSR